MHPIRLLLAAASGALALGPRQIVPDNYIVSFKQDIRASGIDSHLSWVRGLYGEYNENAIEKVWKDNFKGYSGHFDEETIEEIRQRNDVSSV